MALHNVKVKLRVKFDLGSLWNTPFLSAIFMLQHLCHEVYTLSQNIEDVGVYIMTSVAADCLCNELGIGEEEKDL